MRAAFNDTLHLLQDRNDLRPSLEVSVVRGPCKYTSSMKYPFSLWMRAIHWLEDSVTWSCKRNESLNFLVFGRKEKKRSKKRSETREMADSATWVTRSRSLNLSSLHFQTAQFPKFTWPPPFFSYSPCCLLPFFQDQEKQKAETSYLLPLLFIIQVIFFLFVHSLQVTWQSWLLGQLLPLPDGLSACSDSPTLQELSTHWRANTQEHCSFQ